MKNGKNMGAGKAGFIRRAGKQEHERKREEMLPRMDRMNTDGEKTLKRRKRREF